MLLEVLTEPLIVGESVNLRAMASNLRAMASNLATL